MAKDVAQGFQPLGHSVKAPQVRAALLVGKPLARPVDPSTWSPAFSFEEPRRDITDGALP